VKGYTPPYNIEKNYLIAMQKRNLLLRKRLAHQNLNKEVSNERSRFYQAGTISSINSRKKFEVQRSIPYTMHGRDRLWR